MKRKRQIKRVMKWDGNDIWVSEDNGQFTAHASYLKALLRITSPTLMRFYGQDDLAHAFHIGFLNH